MPTHQGLARQSLARACGALLLAAFASVHAASESDAAALQRLQDTRATRDWVWRAAVPGQRAEFHGVVSYDAAGSGAGNMMYPGVAGAAGLLVGILTHAAINEGTRSAEAKRIEQQADKVLLPLRDRLDTLMLSDIQQLALPRLAPALKARLSAPDERVGDAWVVEARPVFLLTQDRRAMVLESIVRVFDSEAKMPLFERAVRVVSPPVQGEDIDAYWRGSDAAAWAQTSAALMAEGVRTALLDSQVVGEPAQRTVRYVEGGADKFERATMLSDRCGRIAMRTLRGGVMSVPAKMRPGAGQADEAKDSTECGTPWPVATAPTVASTVADAAPAPAPVPTPDGTDQATVR